MIGQSFAIIAVILVMSIMFLRAGKRAGALFALPLISVPVFHLIGLALQGLTIRYGFNPVNMNVIFDILGLIFGAWLCFKLSRAITVIKLRNIYFISCVIFLGALAAAYVVFHL